MGKTALEYLLCIVIWCYVAPAQALSLSEIELKSFLNQQLDARVALGNVSEAELESMEVGFLQASNDSVGAHYALTAEIVNDSTGRYIRISSRQIIREPVVTFTLELVWSAGRIQREYSLLIDPKN